MADPAPAGAPTVHPPSFATRYVTLFAGEAVSKLCVMGAFAWLARALPPSDYGTVELALAVMVFVVLGVESGMGLYGASVVAAAPERLPTLVPQVMVLRAALGIPIFALLLVTTYFVAPAAFGILAVNGIAVLLTPFLLQWVFQGLREMQFVAAGAALRNLTFAAIVVLLVRPGVDIRWVAAAEVCGVAALALFNVIVLFGRLRAKLDWHGWRGGTARLFRSVWFMGFGDLTWAGLWYAPALILGWLGQPEQVAWIAAAVRVVVALHTFVWLFFFNLMPNLSRELAVGVPAWRDLMLRSLGAALWPAVLIGVGGTLVAPLLMPVVFGAAYQAAVLPAQIAIWMIPITWFSGHFRFSLIAAGRQRFETMISAVSAAAGAVSALLVGGIYGSQGAAAALVAAGLVNALLAVAAVNRQIGSVPLGALRPVSVAAAIALGTGFVASHFGGPLAGSVAGCSVFMVVAARHDNEIIRKVRQAAGR